jgi:hypothetical protein
MEAVRKKEPRKKAKPREQRQQQQQQQQQQDEEASSAMARTLASLASIPDVSTLRPQDEAQHAGGDGAGGVGAADTADVGGVVDSTDLPAHLHHQPEEVIAAADTTTDPVENGVGGVSVDALERSGQIQGQEAVDAAAASGSPTQIGAVASAPPAWEETPAPRLPPGQSAATLPAWMLQEQQQQQ